MYFHREATVGSYKCPTGDHKVWKSSAVPVKSVGEIYQGDQET